MTEVTVNNETEFFIHNQPIMFADVTVHDIVRVTGFGPSSADAVTAETVIVTGVLQPTPPLE